MLGFDWVGRGNRGQSAEEVLVGQRHLVVAVFGEKLRNCFPEDLFLLLSQTRFLTVTQPRLLQLEEKMVKQC